MHSGADKSGRGGWTWYTGSAGWLYRAGVEGILGLTLSGGNRLTVKPALPYHWPGYEAQLHLSGSTRSLVVKRRDTALHITLDGKEPDGEGGFLLL